MALPDLIERLRRERPWFNDLQKAADEIERLRAALKELLETDEEYVRINNLHNSDGTPATNHAMRRARAVLYS